MNKLVFLDSNVFFDCLEKPDKKATINHAINRDYQFVISLTVIGEVILIIKRDFKSDYVQYLIDFFSMLTDWKIQIYVPDENVAVICYEFSEDYTDGRIINQKTDRVHLAYAIAYECNYFVTSDDALIRYRIPPKLEAADWYKPETLTFEEFKKIVNS